jgi:hypothetical protein
VTTLKVGARVHITALNRVSGYHPGDRGTVVWGPNTSFSGKDTYYLVQMEKNPAGNAVTFLPDEIERDL